MEYPHPHPVGLVDRVRSSTITEQGATEATLDFAPMGARGEIPMCGNSICQDRRFMARHMLSWKRFSTIEI